MRRHPFKRLLAGALGLIVLGCVWFYFAPTPLGGSTSYVVTHGISMEPLFHTGDLAIVRSKPSYHVGEIVAYNNKMLHVVALHRIVGREGDRFLFKGDNNNFIDTEHPRANQLIGALWIHIHGGGTVLQSFSSPARAGLLIAIGMLLLTGGVFARRRRRRGRERHAAISVPRAPRTLPLDPSGPAVAILAIGAVVLLPFLALTLLAFSRAPTTRRAAKIPYTQSGTMSYSAGTEPDAVYPEGVARTGEPLFTQLVNDVNLRFHYKFATTAKHSLAGTGSFQLLLSASDGWHRTLQVGSPTHFKGDRATIASTLDLGSLLALARSVEATTHVDSGYMFAVVPTITINGNVETVPVHATFAPAIQFLVNSDEISLQGAESRSSLLGGSTSRTAGQLTPSASGAATGEQSQPRGLALGPWHLSVSAARTLALSAVGIILAAMLAALALIRPILALMASRRRDEATSILARYRGLIVSVARMSPLPGVAVIDVADMDALARIAEHYERSILHETTADGDAFWVADESGQFRYTIGAPELAVHDVPAPPQSHLEDPPTLEHAVVGDTPAWPQEIAPEEAAWPQQPAPEEPAWPQPPAPEEPVWPQEPAWTQDVAPEQPAWVGSEQPLEPTTAELLIGQVYADELGLGGVPTDSAPPANGEIAATDGAWTVPADQQTFVQEGVDRRRTDEDVDVSLWRRNGQDGDASLRRASDEDPGESSAQAAASGPNFTGLEWTTNS
jgi:signal peptidase I